MKPVATIFCASCKTGLVISQPFPPTCPLCQGTPHWSLENPTPRVPYTLNPDDRRFLRSFRIRPD